MALLPNTFQVQDFRVAKMNSLVFYLHFLLLICFITRSIWEGDCLKNKTTFCVIY